MKKIEMKLQKLSEGPLTHTDKELLRGIFMAPNCNVFETSESDKLVD